MFLIINEDTDETEKEYEDCHTYLHFKIFSFYIHWFLDCGEWFINIGNDKWNYRISSAGNIFTKKQGGQNG